MHSARLTCHHDRVSIDEGQQQPTALSPSILSTFHPSIHPSMPSIQANKCTHVPDIGSTPPEIEARHPQCDPQGDSSCVPFGAFRIAVPFIPYSPVFANN